MPETAGRFSRISGRSFDVVIIGGGINGAAVARDAALRGLSVALFEQHDFASGTSSRTSRLIHGGIRYLEQGALGLVRRASRERAILLSIAPHLVRPIPFLFPSYRDSRSPMLLRAGLLLYEALAGFVTPGHYRILSAEKLSTLEPALRSDGLRGGALYYDAFMEDSRLCIETLLSAREAGAEIFNYARVVRLLSDGERAIGVAARDAFSKEEIVVGGEAIVNAAGPWLDEVAGLEGLAPKRLRTTKGSHLIVPRFTNHAVILTSKRDQRVFFVLPWRKFSIIGTTDLDFSGRPEEVFCAQEEIEYLTAESKRNFPSVEISKIISTYSGVRPLLGEAGGASRRPSDVTREMRIAESPRGVILIIGGKYTLHRRTGSEVVDRILRRPAFSKQRRRGSITASTPLPGARGPDIHLLLTDGVKRIVREYGVSEGTAKHLIDSYGFKAEDILKRGIRNSRLLEPLAPGADEILAEVHHGVAEEMALRLSDLLRRRTSAALLPYRRDEGMIKKVADEMAGLLGWDEARRKDEIADYLAELG